MAALPPSNFGASKNFCTNKLFRYLKMTLTFKDLTIIVHLVSNGVLNSSLVNLDNFFYKNTF